MVVNTIGLSSFRNFSVNFSSLGVVNQGVNKHALLIIISTK